MNSDNKKSRKAPKGSEISFKGTILITVCITLAFALLIYVMYIFDLITFIDLADTLEKNKASHDLSTDDEVLYDNLVSKAQMDSFQLLYELDPSDLTVILSKCKPRDNYFLISEISNYTTEAYKTIRIEATKNNDVFDIKKFNDGTLFESIVSSGNIVEVTDELRDRSAKQVQTDELIFEVLCSMPSIKTITDVCNDIISGSTDVVEYDISLISDGEHNLYKATFTYPDILQREEYYVSLDSEMIVKLDSYINNELYYSYTLLEFKELIS